MDEQKYKQALSELKQTLLDDLQRGEQAAEVVELEQNKVGRLSRMDAMQQQAMQKAGRALLQQRLIQVERAFQAIEDGEYGDCQECGEPIPEQRLQIRPETLVCVSCQENLESSG